MLSINCHCSKYFFLWNLIWSYLSNLIWVERIHKQIIWYLLWRETVASALRQCLKWPSEQHHNATWIASTKYIPSFPQHSINVGNVLLLRYSDRRSELTLVADLLLIADTRKLPETQPYFYCFNIKFFPNFMSYKLL